MLEQLDTCAGQGRIFGGVGPLSPLGAVSVMFVRGLVLWRLAAFFGLVVVAGVSSGQELGAIPEPPAIFIGSVDGVELSEVYAVRGDEGVVGFGTLSGSDYVLRVGLISPTEAVELDDAQLPEGKTTVGRLVKLSANGIAQARVRIGDRGSVVRLASIEFREDQLPDELLPILIGTSVGSCVPDCGEGELCRVGECVSICSSDSDCGPGACLSGGCATRTPTPIQSPTPATPAVTPPTLSTATPSTTPTGQPTPTPTPTCEPVACVGDCDLAGSVSAGELTAIIARIANCGGAPEAECLVPGSSLLAPSCRAGDRNCDGLLTAGELTNAIANVVFGCPEQ